MDPVLDLYLKRFGNLHRNKNAAPHKPVLLLAVLAEIERGSINSNRIALTPELVASFRAYWRILVTVGNWQDRIANPFRFMIYDKLWDLVKDGEVVEGHTIGVTPSIKQLNERIDYARLEPALWLLLQNANNLQSLRAHLLHVYFGTETVQVVNQLPANPLNDDINRLMEEAQGTFRTRKVREDHSDGRWIRHALFPRVVKNLYNETCAVCRLSGTTPTRASIVDAVHIIPFRIDHFDDPRNGMTLCKNHHWAFDAGGITVDNDYKILMSTHLAAPVMFVLPNSTLLLPADQTYAPAKEALEWHRANVYLG